MSQPDVIEALAAARQQIEDLTKILIREGGFEGAYERQLAQAIRERDEAQKQMRELAEVAARNVNDARHLQRERDEARAEAARFKEIARQRSEDYLAANTERVKAVEKANNPSMEVPCGHCGTKFIADEFTCGDCMDEVDEKCFAENMRELAERQREADIDHCLVWLGHANVGVPLDQFMRETPLVTEGGP